MGKKYRKWYALAAAFLLILLVAPSAFAVEIKSGSTVNVSGQLVKGPLFISGDNVTVDADVDGDVFAAGQSITINGKVSGDVIAAGNSIWVNGTIEGDVRAAGNTVDIGGLVEGSVTGAGNNVTISTNADVKRDALIIGRNIIVTGAVAGQVLGGAEQVKLDGIINDDVRLWNVNNLSIGPAAVIDGSVIYNSDNQAQVSSDAQIGEITKLAPPVQPEKPGKTTREGFSFLGLLWSLAAGLLVWGIFSWLFPGLLPRLAQTVKESPGASLGWGILALLVSPLAVILLLVTVIGIPLAFLLIFSLIIIFMVSKVIISDTLARLMTRYFKWEGRFPLIVPFLLSMLAIALISKIPVAGFFVSLLIICISLGIIILAIYRARETNLN